jgi:excisionase family DNA binding protein
MDEKLLNIGQAAEILGVSIDTLRRWDESGKLIAIRKKGGTHRYYREEDLEIFASDLFKFASEWVINKTAFPGTFYCQTSSVFQARLVKMELELMRKPGFEKLYSLIV